MIFAIFAVLHYKGIIFYGIQGNITSHIWSDGFDINNGIMNYIYIYIYYYTTYLPNHAREISSVFYDAANSYEFIRGEPCNFFCLRPTLNPDLIRTPTLQNVPATLLYCQLRDLIWHNLHLFHYKWHTKTPLHHFVQSEIPCWEAKVNWPRQNRMVLGFKWAQSNRTSHGPSWSRSQYSLHGIYCRRKMSQDSIKRLTLPSSNSWPLRVPPPSKNIVL